MIKIFGNSVQGIEDDDLIGFTIYNKTKGEYAKVITSTEEGDNTRINHTLYNSTWETDDVVIIGRNWISPADQAVLSDVSLREYAFHNVLNDLRIGFGGYENRPGLAIGYRKKYFMIQNIDFPNVHGDINADLEDTLENLSVIDGVILDTNILNPEAYGIGLTLVAGDATENTHYFRLTGVIDGFQEQLIADNSIVTDGTKNIEVYPFIKLGLENPRITNFKLYHSTNNITFFKIKEYVISANQFSPSFWKVDEFGRLYIGSIELYNESNAAHSIEINSVGSWTEYPINQSRLTVDSVGASGSSYSLKYGTSALIKPGSPDSRSGIKFPFGGLKRNTTYNLSIYAKSNTATGTLYAFFIGESEIQTGRPQTEIAITNAFVQYNIEVSTGGNDEDPMYLVISHYQVSAGFFWIDLVSLKEKGILEYTGSTVQGTEMKTEIGYNATYNMVKGWDHVLVNRNRAYYVNPYTDERFENFIYASNISRSGYMYDIASATTKAFEVERHDGNKTLGIALLSTLELLVVKDKSIMSVDPETGAVREPIFGNTCVSRHTIVNINGVIRWCGLEDIYQVSSEGFYVRGLLKETIRDIYLKLNGKYTLFAIRDKFNTYRLRTYDADNRTEFLLSENGWIEEKKSLLPEIYRAGYTNQMYFLASGNIYAVETELDYTSMGEIIMDDSLITE